MQSRSETRSGSLVSEVRLTTSAQRPARSLPGEAKVCASVLSFRKRRRLTVLLVADAFAKGVEVPVVVVWGVKNSVRAVRNNDLQAEREF